jgi:hypothetical protein
MGILEGLGSIFKGSNEKKREHVFKSIASIKDDVLISENYKKAVTDLQSLLNNYPEFKMDINAEIKRLEEILALNEEHEDERNRIANLWRLDHIIEQKNADKEELLENLKHNPDNADELFAELENVDAELERAMDTKESIISIGRTPGIRVTDDPIQRIQDEIVVTYVRQAKRRKERATSTSGSIDDRTKNYAELQRILEEDSASDVTPDLFKNLKLPTVKRTDPKKAERKLKLEAEIAKRCTAEGTSAGDKNKAAILERIADVDSKIDSLKS